MALTKYTKSVVTDFVGLTQASPNIGSLNNEINSSSIVIALDHIDINNDVVDIWFKDILSSSTPDDVTTLNNIVAAHTGVSTLLTQDINIKDSSINMPTNEYGFSNLTGYNVYYRGYRYVALKNQMNVFDISYTSDYKLQGLGFRVDNQVVDGDYISVQIVDVDGIVYPAGTILITFADNMYLWPNRELRVLTKDVKTLYSWSYLRFIYNSVGLTNDVVLYVENYLRTLPV